MVLDSDDTGIVELEMIEVVAVPNETEVKFDVLLP